jgi:16S rRNA (cytidine1402-2'-O)-methyltransferase
MPDRQMMVARELTKMFETIYRGTASEIDSQISDSETRGEFVIIITAK